LLERLEAEAEFDISQSEGYHLGPAFETMAKAIRSLPAPIRGQTLAALPIWLRDYEHPWHAEAAMKIGVLLKHTPTLDAAVKEAYRLGLGYQRRSSPAAWWLFHMNLVVALSEARPSAKAIAYLRAVQQRAHQARSASMRDISTRAWCVLCHLVDGDEELGCVAAALKQAWVWKDPGIVKSALGLLYSIYKRGTPGRAALESQLTRAERQLVAKYIDLPWLPA
jgi:hypothetical protein